MSHADDDVVGIWYEDDQVACQFGETAGVRRVESVSRWVGGLCVVQCLRDGTRSSPDFRDAGNSTI